MDHPTRDGVLIDALTGVPIVVQGDRQDRPAHTGPSSEVAPCPFCPGGLEAPEPYDVRWFVNRWPALPDGRAEILLYTPRHEASLWSLGVGGVRRVVDLWADRTTALGRRPDVSYVLIFENRGADVGATVSHPHGQVYAFADVPPVPARELSGPACALCGEEPGDREVAAVGGQSGPTERGKRGWRAWVPAASGWPYGLIVAPQAHLPDLPSLGGAERDELASVLVDVLSRLDHLFAAPMPYMLWIHQRPTDGDPWPAAHVHVEVAPLWRAPGVPRYVAAGELGSGVLFNPVPPLDAARRLRHARP